MAELISDAERLQNLLALWEQLAVCWVDSDHADRLRNDVIARMQTGSKSLAGVWLNQAVALAAWPALAGEDPSASSLFDEWDSLRQLAEELYQRVREARPADKSRLFVDLAAFLKQSSHAFATLAAPEKASPYISPSQAIQQQIEQTLAQAPPNWPPMRVAAFLSRISEQDAAVRLGQLLEESGADWRSAVEAAFAEVPDTVREVIVLLRVIVDAFLERDAASTVWTEVAKLARELLPPDQFQVELIRDPKQPVAWFEPTEAEVPSPRVDRVGLAVRCVGRDWVCLPRGRLSVPKPVPRNAARDAAESLAPLIAENPWLSRLSAQLASFNDGPFEAWLSRMLDDLAADIADFLPSIRELSSSHTGALDDVLNLLRASGIAEGLEILPRNWRFAHALSYADLRNGERNYIAVFRPNEPRGTVYRIRMFGLKRGEEIVRPFSVAVSAGPMPFGFRELENLVKENPNEETLRERLRCWRDAGLAETLELTAVQFYVDFWGALGDGLRQRDPAHAREFSEQLNQLLQHEFRLFPFHPVAFQDFPDGWVQRKPGRQMTTGLVRRVVRPGLHDGDNQLRVPALVEVE